MERVNTVDEKLYNSSCRGDLGGVLAALAQGGRVAMRNHQGFSPLLAAAQYGQTDICGLLLSHGSNVNEVFSETNWTALHFASVSGHYATVEALLLWGAVVDPRDHAGMTPLYGACQEGHMACVLILLKAGASVSVDTVDLLAPVHRRVLDQHWRTWPPGKQS